MNTKPTSFLVFVNGTIECAEVTKEKAFEFKENSVVNLKRFMISMIFSFDFLMSSAKIGNFVR